MEQLVQVRSLNWERFCADDLGPSLLLAPSLGPGWAEVLPSWQLGFTGLYNTGVRNFATWEH